MGHSSIAVTLDRYGHLLPSIEERIAVGLGEAYRSAAVDTSLRGRVVGFPSGHPSVVRSSTRSGIMRGMFRRRKRQSGSPGDPQEVYLGLRRNALGAVDKGLPSPSAAHPDVAGVVVDIRAEGGFATVVAMTDNTTSMYTSVGGGVIGAGEHAHVAEATQRLLVAVQAQLGLFRQPDDGEFPASGAVRFHAVTPSANRVVDVPEEAFWGHSPH